MTTRTPWNKLGAPVAIALLICASLPATAGFVVYNADVLPSSDGWTLNGSAPLSVTTTAGIVQLQTEADPSWYSRAELTGASWTVEWRMRVKEGGGQGTPNDIDIWFNAGGYYVDVSSNQIDMFGNPSQAVVLDTSAFHTYRMTSIGNLYIDDILEITGANRAFPSTLIEFGDGTTRGSGVNESHWDYIAWTNEGAFSPDDLPSLTPIPEPVSLSLVGLGLLGIALGRRRGRVV